MRLVVCRQSVTCLALTYLSVFSCCSDGYLFSVAKGLFSKRLVVYWKNKIKIFLIYKTDRVKTVLTLYLNFETNDRIHVYLFDYYLITWNKILCMIP